MLENHLVLPHADDDRPARTEPDHDAIGKEQRLDDELDARRNGKFQQLTDELFEQAGTLPFDRLNEVDQRALAEAYLLDDTTQVREALLNIPGQSVADYIGAMISYDDACNAVESVDLIELGVAIWRGIWPNRHLSSLVEGEYDYRARHWNAEHHDSQPYLMRRQAD